jgi:hypothetical protein
MKNNKISLIKKIVVTFLFMSLTMTLCFGQEEKDTNRDEVDFKVISTEIQKFDKTIKIGAGKRAIEYKEAFVLKLMVNQEEFDALPPSIEPFLYIGVDEYRIFHIDRTNSEKGLLKLIFHIRDWEKLDDGEVMVLTINHGDPIRNAEKYKRRKLPRFNKNIIVDMRKSE